LFPLPHHCASSSGSVNARQTRSRLALKILFDPDFAIGRQGHVRLGGRGIVYGFQ